MAYTKQTWENLPSTNTPLTAERLNHMEDGIAEAWEHGEGGAGETLPVGSEIEFDGLSTDIPAGWEQVEYPTVLYENSIGEKTGTLSDDISNYSYVDIVYGRTDYPSTTRIYNGFEDSTNILSYSYKLSNVLRIYTAMITFSGTSFSQSNEGYINFQSTSAVDSGSVADLKVYKIVGYK